MAYIVSSFVYYWWHRWRHTSTFWWNLCHQLQHSARRIEVNNYADLPLFDIAFGTYVNPRQAVVECGFTEAQEDRFEDLLAFRNVHDREIAASSPLHFLPTCIGCRKRWACTDARSDTDGV